MTPEQMLELVEAGIRDIMDCLGATYITISLAKNDHVEIAYCGDGDGTEVEVEGATLAEAFNEAKYQIKSMDKTF